MQIDSSFIGLLTGLGIGSGITAFMQHLLKKNEVEFLSQRQELEKRYRVIILLMYAAFDYNTNEAVFRTQRPDLKSKEDVLEELKAEWFNMLLFASEDAQLSLYDFICAPNLKNLKQTAISMREDLGRSKLGALVEDLTFSTEKGI